MTNEPLKRNRYAYPPSLECSINGSNLNRDFDDYHLPHSRLALASLQDWGVAQGLEVTGIIGNTEIAVNTGAALDGQGQLIWLASNGSGTLDINPPTKVPVPVQLNTSNYQRAEDTAYYLTITFFEWEQREVGRPCDRVLEQVPWIRLQPISGDSAYVDDGTSVVLGQVVIDSEGKLKELKTDGRRLVGKTVEQLQFRRADKAADQIQQVSAAKIKPAASGGLQITVPDANDKVLLEKEGGGNFTKLEVHTDTLDVAGNIKASELQGTRLQLSADGAIAGSLSIQNDLSVSHNADIRGNLKISGNLEVQGNVIARDTEHIAGNVSLGDADNDEVKITGVVRSGHSSGALQVDGALQTKDSLKIGGNLENTAGKQLIEGGSKTDWLRINPSTSFKKTAIHGDVAINGGGAGLVVGAWESGIGQGKLKVHQDAYLAVSGGNVGIGTTTPGMNLEVGDFSTSAHDNYIGIRTPGGNKYKAGIKLRHWQEDHGFTIESDETQRILNIIRESSGENRFSQSALAIQFITGNVGIGTTNPGSALEVNGWIYISGGNGLRFYNSNKSQYWHIYPQWTDAGDPDLMFDFSGKTREPGWVRGWLEPEGGWKQPSDQRFKQDIEPLSHVLERVMKLQPKSYHWINTGNNSSKFFGFIAQEVEKVFPDFVTEKRGIKAMKYDDFAVLAIAAIQEQQELLTQLKEEIANLKEQVQNLSLA